MKLFSITTFVPKLLLGNVLLVLFTLFFVGCNDNKKQTEHICPQCNMPLPKSNINTSYIDKQIYFDDIGCMILWVKENKIDLSDKKVKLFTSDTKKYIDITKVYFTINEKTPMNYGFTPYENKKENMIDFNEIQLRMLRGEHMANPKIRKQILGY